MSQVFNTDFFNKGRPPIEVENGPSSRLIQDVFYNPGYSQEPGPVNHSRLNVPSVVVRVFIDFETFKKDRKLEVTISPINFTRKCVDPNELLSGYPFNEIMCWKNSNGENFASWSSRINSRGLTRPSERELFGGKTRAEIRKEEDLSYIKAVVKKGRR